MQDRRLYWVGRNRTRPDRTKNAGKLVADFARSLDGGQADLAAAAAVLNPVVDDDFRRHCTVSAVGGGVINIRVNDPGLVAGMRLQWAARLLTAIQEAREFSSIRRIVFELGTGGKKFQN